MLSLRGINGGQVGIPVLLAAVLAGCGGGAAKSDADAVSQVLKDAAHAVAHQDGDKACGYLTPDAQRQAELQVGAGVLGQTDCSTLVNRATAFLSPLDKTRIKNLQPTNVQVNGTAASARLAAEGMSIDLNL